MPPDPSVPAPTHRRLKRVGRPCRGLIPSTPPYPPPCPSPSRGEGTLRRDTLLVSTPVKPCPHESRKSRFGSSGFCVGKIGGKGIERDHAAPAPQTLPRHSRESMPSRKRGRESSFIALVVQTSPSRMILLDPRNFLCRIPFPDSLSSGYCFPRIQESRIQPTGTHGCRASWGWVGRMEPGGVFTRMDGFPPPLPRGHAFAGMTEWGVRDAKPRRAWPEWREADIIVCVESVSTHTNS